MISHTVPDLPAYDFDALEYQSSLLYRLADEHRRIHQLMLANPEMISYEVIKTSREHPKVPLEYNVFFYVNSYVGLTGEGNPITEKHHSLNIQISMQYPAQPAQLKMTSPTWHPNIKSDGPFKGTICSNHQGFGSLYYLDELCVRVGQMLQYQKYWIIMAPPYPEDMKVAQWVTDIAEPQDLVNKEKGKFLDDRGWKEYQFIEFTEIDFKELDAQPPEEEASSDHEDIDFIE